MKNLLRKWLGISKLGVDVLRMQELIYAPREKSDLVIDVDSRVRRSIDEQLSVHSALDEMAALHQKIDAIAEAVGVHVVADFATGNNAAIVVRDETRLNHAQAVSDYALAAKQVMDLHIASAREMLRMAEVFNRELKK